MNKSKEVTTPRTGKRALAFTGEPLAKASSRDRGGKESNRWHELEVWKTESGKYVVSVRYHTQWQGETDFDDAVVFDGLNEVGAFLEGYKFPNAASIGFPPREVYADRQARLMVELESGFRAVTAELLGKLGCVERV